MILYYIYLGLVFTAQLFVVCFSVKNLFEALTVSQIIFTVLALCVSFIFYIMYKIFKYLPDWNFDDENDKGGMYK